MWNILILEEPADHQDVLDKQNVVNLLDVLFEDFESKAAATFEEPAETRHYSNADVLDILRVVHRECFQTVPNFEVSLTEVEKGRAV